MTNINLNHLRLFTMGDKDTERMMLEEIAVELKCESAKITQLVAQQDWHNLSRVAHKLKTTLPFIGNQFLIDLNKNIEENSKSGTNLDKIPSLTQEFTKTLPIVIAEIETYL
jgi:HPt (histidine-containing phosphotransfer) domain-containing protein